MMALFCICHVCFTVPVVNLYLESLAYLILPTVVELVVCLSSAIYFSVFMRACTYICEHHGMVEKPEMRIHYKNLLFFLCAKNTFSQGKKSV